MRRVEVRRFGGPEVLVTAEAPDPVAGPGQVVVDVAAADVLHVETGIRAGLAREWFPVVPPYVPGSGVSGRVLSVGEGVDPSWAGRNVAARVEGGGYAEQALAEAAQLVAVPDAVGLPDAAALLHDGPTAYGVLDGAAPQPGEWVLITGASGGMGVLLVQLVRAAGAHVAATARGTRKADLVRSLGADLVVDPSDPGWTKEVREATAGTGPQVVFDGAGGPVGAAALELVAPGGRFSAHGAAAGGFALSDRDEATRRGVTVRGIEHVQYAPDVAVSLIKRSLADAAAGRIRPVIGQTFTLDQASDAHAAVENRTVVAKTLLLPRH